MLAVVLCGHCVGCGAAGTIVLAVVLRVQACWPWICERKYVDREATSASMLTVGQRVQVLCWPWCCESKYVGRGAASAS